MLQAWVQLCIVRYRQTTINYDPCCQQLFMLTPIFYSFFDEDYLSKMVVSMLNDYINTSVK